MRHTHGFSFTAKLSKCGQLRRVVPNIFLVDSHPQNFIQSGASLSCALAGSGAFLNDDLTRGIALCFDGTLEWTSFEFDFE